MRTMGLQLMLGLLLLLVFHAASAQTLSVELSGLKHDRGLVRCGLFNDEDGWRQENRAVRVATGAIRQGRAACDFGELPPGVYAIAAYHAEHAEDHLRLGLFGRPQQAVGFSLNPSRLFGAPSFEAAMFRMDREPRHLKIEME